MRVAPIAALLLCACATDPVWEERYAEGWRRADLYRIANRFRGAGAFPGLFVVHPLPQSLALQEGERVLVNVKNRAAEPRLL